MARAPLLVVLLLQLRTKARLADALTILDPFANDAHGMRNLPSTTLNFFGPQAFRLNTTGAPLVTLNAAMTARLCEPSPPWPAAIAKDGDDAALVTGAVVMLDMSDRHCGIERVYAHLHAARALAVLEGGYYTTYPGAQWMARDGWDAPYQHAGLVWLSVSRDVIFDAIRTHRTALATATVVDEGTISAVERYEGGNDDDGGGGAPTDDDDGRDGGGGGVRVDVGLSFILEPTPNVWRRFAEGAVFTLVTRVGYTALALAAGAVAARNLRARHRSRRGAAPSGSSTSTTRNCNNHGGGASRASGGARGTAARRCRGGCGIVWSAITVVLAVEVRGRVCDAAHLSKETSDRVFNHRSA